MARIREIEESEDEGPVREFPFRTLKKERKTPEESGSSSDNESRSDVGEGNFSPPLFRQRYIAISSILERQEPEIKRVIDFGCAEGTFISIYLKKIPMDIDPLVLEEGRHKTAPLIYEHLHPRKNPLDIYLLQGDAAQIARALRNRRYTLESFRNTLWRTPSTNGQDSATRITSLNGRERSLRLGVRHNSEFPDYSVEYSGVGFSAQHPELGPCSQIATFSRELSSPNAEHVYIRDSEEPTLYATRVHHSYPLLGNLEYYINDCCNDDHLSLSFLSQFSLVKELTEDLEVIRRVVEMEGEYHVVVPPMLDEYLPLSNCSFDDYDDEYNPDDYYEPIEVL
ncbi:Uncharacterized protein FKW44_023637 [Caligus rogercresseyi]|uniref:Small RNA 2'-O-methyltransferase n=1 Tax=Caligus rogercresseyi TaxID=217165 RepID=A0A7T8GPR1_CALRO|nr:Uncharacterized protein FKW44_023637 [Caligus rogercresseyi]